MGQVLQKSTNKRKRVENFECKDEYFIKNGGILLEKQMALSKGQYVNCDLKLISYDKIKRATNNYDPQLICAHLRDANVYRGTLDDRVVVIKTPKQPDMNTELVDLFLTEVSISMVTSHENMNRILGCCLETFIPIIVYDYERRSRSLHEMLHGGMAAYEPVKWVDRLRGASDVAFALSYMHNALSKPLVHRDVKSSGILVDNSFHVILANVAYAVSITPGKKEQRWPVYGTPGYIDPEYTETRVPTDKCDVYSFGVLMLELLTGMDPLEMAKRGKDLVGEFVCRVEIDGVIRSEMIDKNLVEEGSLEEIERFARIALRCVAKKGEERPTMINVVEELWRIQAEGDNRG